MRARALCSRAHFFLQTRGDFARALADFKLAHDEHPRDADVAFGLGLTCCFIGRSPARPPARASRTIASHGALPVARRQQGPPRPALPCPGAEPRSGRADRCATCRCHAGGCPGPHLSGLSCVR
jgi:hypothetical protein